MVRVFLTFFVACFVRVSKKQYLKKDTKIFGPQLYDLIVTIVKYSNFIFEPKVYTLIFIYDNI